MDINQIESTDSPPVPEMITSSEDERVRARISSDLTQKQDSYRNKSAFMNQMINQTELSESSIRRYIKGETTPSFEMIKKIYAFILDKDKEEVSLNDYPSVIKNHYFRSNINERKDINELLNKSNAHRDIYWLTSNSTIVNIKSLSQHHGVKSIMTAINDLEKEKVIKFVDEDHVTSGPVGEILNSKYVCDNAEYLSKLRFNRESFDNSEKINLGAFGIFNLNDSDEKEFYNKLYEAYQFARIAQERNLGGNKICVSLLYENLNKTFESIEMGELQ